MSSSKHSEDKGSSSTSHCLRSFVEKKILIEILIVDDSPVNQKLLAKALELLAKDQKSYYFKIVTAENGQKAVDTVANNSVNLVFMDQEMPIMDGQTAVNTIRETNKTVPIICFSSTVKTPDDLKKTTGMNDFITKPLCLEKLKLIIKTYILSNPFVSSVAPALKAAKVISPSTSSSAPSSSSLALDLNAAKVVSSPTFGSAPSPSSMALASDFELLSPSTPPSSPMALASDTDSEILSPPTTPTFLPFLPVHNLSASVSSLFHHPAFSLASSVTSSIGQREAPSAAVF